MVDAIGQQLKAAREKKRISLSQAAAKTHIKIQHLEAIERDDFGRIPAPTYAKGFIRMYAEFLDLDPAPLVKAYVDRFAPRSRPSIMPDESAKPVAAAEPAASHPLPWRAWLQQARALLGKVAWRRIGSVAAAVVVLGFALVGVTRCVARAPRAQPETTAVQEPARPLRRTPLAIAQEPREPYLNVPPSAAP